MFGMNGWCKEIPGGDLISREAAIDAVRTYYDDEYALADSIEELIEKLPSAQPDKSIVEDCLYRIYRNTSVYTATEGRVAIKHYMGELWRELFGEEDVPEWMT